MLPCKYLVVDSVAEVEGSATVVRVSSRIFQLRGGSS